MKYLSGVLVVLALAVPATAQATLIGDAHRAIAASFHPQSAGFNRDQIAACRRVGRREVECRVVLTEPAAPLTCQPGTQLYVPAGIGVCEVAPATTTVTLRVRRGRLVSG